MPHSSDFKARLTGAGTKFQELGRKLSTQVRGGRQLIKGWGDVKMEVKVGGTLIRLVQGDITQQETDAIVNAANSSLMGGGGVDGAIHRAGGPEILEQCKKIRAERGPCPTGEAVITTAGRMRARFVIHAVGPIWHGGTQSEDELLSKAYYNSLRLAKEHGIRTISFPSISTGAYRFPIERAARIAMRTVKEFVEQNEGFDEVRFVLFTAPDLKVYEEALREIAL